jgi:hypothetical protein
MDFSLLQMVYYVFYGSLNKKILLLHSFYFTIIHYYSGTGAGTGAGGACAANVTRLQSP